MDLFWAIPFYVVLAVVGYFVLGAALFEAYNYWETGEFVDFRVALFGIYYLTLQRIIGP